MAIKLSCVEDVTSTDLGLKALAESVFQDFVAMEDFRNQMEEAGIVEDEIAEFDEVAANLNKAMNAIRTHGCTDEVLKFVDGDGGLTSLMERYSTHEPVVALEEAQKGLIEQVKEFVKRLVGKLKQLMTDVMRILCAGKSYAASISQTIAAYKNFSTAERLKVAAIMSTKEVPTAQQLKEDYTFAFGYYDTFSDIITTLGHNLEMVMDAARGHDVLASMCKRWVDESLRRIRSVKSSIVTIDVDNTDVFKIDVRIEKFSAHKFESVKSIDEFVEELMDTISVMKFADPTPIIAKRDKKVVDRADSLIDTANKYLNDKTITTEQARHISRHINFASHIVRASHSLSILLTSSANHALKALASAVKQVRSERVIKTVS